MLSVDPNLMGEVKSDLAELNRVPVVGLLHQLRVEVLQVRRAGIGFITAFCRLGDGAFWLVEYSSDPSACVHRFGHPRAFVIAVGALRKAE